MKFDHLVIRDVEGERRFDAAKLPLRVGTGSDCELRLPGPGGGPVALLDLLNGAPFVQPVGRDAILTINGEPLQTSRGLEPDDELAFFGSRIRVAAADAGLVLEVRLEDSAYVTQPPELPDSAAAVDDETIAAIETREREATGISALKVKDDIDSITGGTRPKDNVVGGADLFVSFFNGRLRWKSEAVARPAPAQASSAMA